MSKKVNRQIIINYSKFKKNIIFTIKDKSAQQKNVKYPFYFLKLLILQSLLSIKNLYWLKEYKR